MTPERMAHARKSRWENDPEEAELPDPPQPGNTPEGRLWLCVIEAALCDLRGLKLDVNEKQPQVDLRKASAELFLFSADVEHRARRQFACAAAGVREAVVQDMARRVLDGDEPPPKRAGLRRAA